MRRGDDERREHSATVHSTATCSVKDADDRCRVLVVECQEPTELWRGQCERLLRSAEQHWHLSGRDCIQTSCVSNLTSRRSRAVHSTTDVLDAAAARSTDAVALGRVLVLLLAAPMLSIVYSSEATPQSLYESRRHQDASELDATRHELERRTHEALAHTSAPFTRVRQRYQLRLLQQTSKQTHLTPIQLHDPIFALHDGHASFPSFARTKSLADVAIHAMGSMNSALHAAADTVASLPTLCTSAFRVVATT